MPQPELTVFTDEHMLKVQYYQVQQQGRDSTNADDPPPAIASLLGSRKEEGVTATVQCSVDTSPSGPNEQQNVFSSIPFPLPNVSHTLN